LLDSAALKKKEFMHLLLKQPNSKREEKSCKSKKPFQRGWGIIFTLKNDKTQRLSERKGSQLSQFIRSVWEGTNRPFHKKSHTEKEGWAKKRFGLGEKGKNHTCLLCPLY